MGGNKQSNSNYHKLAGDAKVDDGQIDSSSKQPVESYGDKAKKIFGMGGAA